MNQKLNRLLDANVAYYAHIFAGYETAEERRRAHKRQQLSAFERECRALEAWLRLREDAEGHDWQLRRRNFSGK